MERGPPSRRRWRWSRWGLWSLASTSQAVRVLKGNLVVAFEGTITPRSCPGPAPRRSGSRWAARSKRPTARRRPNSNRIILEINRHGQLQTKGLATCSLGKLRSISSKGAKRACGDALIGSGLGHLAGLAPRPGRLRLDREAAGLQRRQPRPSGDLCPGRLGCAAAADLRDRLRSQEEGRRHSRPRWSGRCRRSRPNTGSSRRSICCSGASTHSTARKAELRLGGLPGAGGVHAVNFAFAKVSISSPTAATSQANSFASAR